MSDQKRKPMFAAPAAEPDGIPVAAWGVAGLVVLLALAGLLLVGRNKSETRVGGLQPLDPYATSLVISNLQMSESTSLSGGKSTFIDGQIKNNGARTVNGMTVQVLFHNDVEMPMEIETVPLMLIRTHEPYVDTQPLSASPLKPGEQREFRLVFEAINSNWNQQVPDLRVVQVSFR
jgi:hypothetical protein